MITLSCSDDDVVDNGGNDTNGAVTEQTNVEIADVDSIDLYKYWTEVLKDAQQGNSEDDSLEVAEATKQLAAMDSMAMAYIDSIGGNASDKDWTHGQDGDEGRFSWWCMKLYNVRYQSIDENGSPITLSELLVVPVNKIWPCYPNDFVLYCHSTLFNNDDRPSNFYRRESDSKLLKEWEIVARKTSSEAFHTEGIGIIPDFEGFGASSDRNYPCMNLDLLARQAIDGLVAAKELVFNHKLADMEKKWTSAIWGYGEGASIAAAAHMYMENNTDSDGNTLAKNYNFKGSDLIDPILNPKEMFLKLADSYRSVNNNYIYDPILYAYMIKAMCEYDPNLKGKYTVEDFLSEEFLATGIIDFLNDKNKNLDVYVDSLFARSWRGDFDVYLPVRYIKSYIQYYGYTYRDDIQKYNKEWYENEKATKPSFDCYANYNFSSGWNGRTQSVVYYTTGYENPETSVKDYFAVDEESHDVYIKFKDVVRDFYDLYQTVTCNSTWSIKYTDLVNAFEKQSICNRSWNPQYPVYVSYSTYPRALRPALLNVDKFKSSNSSSKLIYYSKAAPICKTKMEDYSNIGKLR